MGFFKRPFVGLLTGIERILCRADFSFHDRFLPLRPMCSRHIRKKNIYLAAYSFLQGMTLQVASMELIRLHYFYVVAREGGFTKASRILRVQQPAISKMVRQLEEHFDLRLLDRGKEGVTLTPIGSEIFKKCQVLFDQVDEIRSLADRQQVECSGPLSMGATDSVSSYLMPRVLGQFLREHPKVSPSLFAGTSNLICSEITEGKIEFGVFFTVPEGDFQVAELVDVPFQLVGPADVTPGEAVKRGFVISREIDYPKSRPFPVLEMLRRNSIEVKVAISSNNLDAQKHLVMEGLGVALLPSFMVKEEIRERKLQGLFPKKQFSYSLKVVTRRRKVLSKNSATFLKFMKIALPELAMPAPGAARKR